MVFMKNECMICGCEYEYDTESAPPFCIVVCSQGCNEKFEKEGWKISRNKGGKQ